MGICCSKKAAAETATKAVVSTGNVSLIVGGAAVGTVIAGPVGTAIGAAIGTVAVGAIGKVIDPPTGLLTDVWRGLLVRAELIDQLPTLGLLRLDRGGAPAPPAVSDLLMERDVNSTLFRVVPATVTGVDLATVRSGAPLTPEQQASLAQAVSKLESKGVIAITADSGACIHMQRAVASQTKLPVLLSPLLQAPLLTAVLGPHETILTITCDSSRFGQADLEATLSKFGLAQTAAASKRFVLKGCEHIPGFAEPERPIDLKAAQSGLIELVKSASAELRQAGRPCGAILLESAMLPAFSDVVRRPPAPPRAHTLHTHTRTT